MSNPFQQQYVKMQFPTHMEPVISISGFTLTGDEDRCVELPRNLMETAKSHGLIEFVAKAKTK